MTSIMRPQDSPFSHVVDMALGGESGEWAERQDGWHFQLVPREHHTGVMVYKTGRVQVNGRLMEKVRRIPGGEPYEHVGYHGLQWRVR